MARKITIARKHLPLIREMILREYYDVKPMKLKTRSGKDFTLVYVDPATSTDDTYHNRELMKKYGMEYLPYNRYIKYVEGVPKAWGWLIWKGQESSMAPVIRKFAEEIGQQETPRDEGQQRTMEEVIQALDELKGFIMNASSTSNGNAIIARAEELKKQLAQGIGSKKTMEALDELIKFRTEMARHMGHKLSFMNTILVWLQKKNATDVRSRGEWREMGYTPKEGATPIILSMPAKFKPFYGAQYDEIVRKFLEKEGAKKISDLTPSQRKRLDRETKYPDIKAGFKDYVAYDISDLVKGENAEEFPENNFEWYIKNGSNTSKEESLINAVIVFGQSLGITYDYKDLKDLGGARGYATPSGEIVLGDGNKDLGLLSTVIHETAHQIMHWEVVKTKNPRLARFYYGGKIRGTEIVEQEAELCSWIILSSFGYSKEEQPLLNYMANWGMNVNNCNNVFDQVFKVAEFVYDGIVRVLNNEKQEG